MMFSAFPQDKRGGGEVETSTFVLVVEILYTNVEWVISVLWWWVISMLRSYGCGGERALKLCVEGALWILFLEADILLRLSSFSHD